MKPLCHCWFDQIGLTEALSYNTESCGNHGNSPPPQKKRICDCEYNIASENQEDVWREAHLAGDK